MSSSDKLNEELFKKYFETKDIEIRNQIVSNNIFLAQTLSRKFIGRGIEYDDLLQIASLALIKAVERYNQKFDTKFITFATPTIIGEIKKYFRDKSSIIKLPRRIHELRSKIGMVKNDLQGELGRVPNADDIAQFLNISIESVLESMEANYNTNMSSIDAGTLNDDQIDLHETFGEDDLSFSLFENSDLIKNIMQELEGFERDFIKMRFYEEKTQSDIAKELNVSQMYVSRLEKKVIEKIRNFIAS